MTRSIVALGSDASGATPAVSVLLPFRNCSPWIEEAILSMSHQTFSDLEIVAVDDASTDGGEEKVRILASKDPRIRLLQPGRVGLVGALNHGLAACKASKVARMDGDDVAEPDRIRLQMEFLERHPEIGVVDSRFTPFSDGGTVQDGFLAYRDWHDGIRTDPDFARQFLVENPVCHPAVLMHKEGVIRAGGYRSGPFPEDYDLWLRLHRSGIRFHKLEERLLRWRDHGARSTRTDPRYSPGAFFLLRWDHLLATRLSRPETPVVVWGAGPSARPWLRHLRARGQRVLAVLDIDPRKVGSTRHGYPVWSPENLDRVQDALILGCVGARGARASISQFLTAAHREEGRDYVFVC